MNNTKIVLNKESIKDSDLWEKAGDRTSKV